MPAVIHHRQRVILDFITQFIQKNKYAPTLREVADAVGLSSLATVHEHIEKLIEKGLLKKGDKEGRAREIALTHKKYASWKGAVDLPVLSYFSAGQPLQTFDKPGITLQVAPNLLTGKKRAYVLQVKDNLLADEGILQGDYLVVEEDQDICRGEIVIVLMENNTAVIKRFFKEETRIRLDSLQPKKAPIFTSKARVQAKVKALVRKYF